MKLPLEYPLNPARVFIKNPEKEIFPLINTRWSTDYSLVDVFQEAIAILDSNASVPYQNREYVSHHVTPFKINLFQKILMNLRLFRNKKIDVPRNRWR